MIKPVQLYNTRTRKVEKFKPITPGVVKMYCCGPTVYNYAHIGNLRTYFFEDTLRRVLELAGYKVNHVMNITDVGHLVASDDEGADESGEDKMAAAARREKKSSWDIAKLYEKKFFNHTKALNIYKPKTICRATDYIPQMQAMVGELIKKGLAYESGGNVYYDTAKFTRYADFAHLKIDNQQATDRVDHDDRKRNQQDFALWFSSSKFPDQEMQWDSPWGRGFPGWHIECSAMATEHLGKHFDIHCGGIDHIPVHHTNEIAQSEGALGCEHDHPWVNYWLHGEFLQIDKSKMSKSKGEFLHLGVITKKKYGGFKPLDLRYLFLTAHYRSHLNFSFESLQHAKNSRNTLRSIRNDLVHKLKNKTHDSEVVSRNSDLSEIIEKFNEKIFYNLETPVALAYLWEILRDEAVSNETKLDVLFHSDRVFGLGLRKEKEKNLAPREQKLYLEYEYTRSKGNAERTNELRQIFMLEAFKKKLPANLQGLLNQREAARAAKDWALSDKLRDELLAKGVKIKDRKDGVDWELVE